MPGWRKDSAETVACRIRGAGWDTEGEEGKNGWGQIVETQFPYKCTFDFIMEPVGHHGRF